MVDSPSKDPNGVWPTTPNLLRRQPHSRHTGPGRLRKCKKNAPQAQNGLKLQYTEPLKASKQK
jgi:hypothetical protein